MSRAFGTVGRHHITAGIGSQHHYEQANNITFAIEKASRTEKKRTFRFPRFVLSFFRYEGFGLSPFTFDHPYEKIDTKKSLEYQGFPYWSE